jgi:uncharacterized protein with HEPN domain
MLASARRALRHIANMTEEDFRADEKTQDAVIRQLEVIGEAAGHVGEATRAKLSHLPWTKIVGQRHIAIHHYKKLNMSRIWATAHGDLPSLIAALEKYLA